MNMIQNIKRGEATRSAYGAATSTYKILKNGTVVRIRQIQAKDKHGIQLGMSQMSPQSRRNRFFSAIKNLPDQTLRDLVEVDHVNHDAWVALTGPLHFPRPVGVARYVRDTHDPHIAEIAIAVVDTFQSQGMGSIFADVLLEAARNRGISEFMAVVLANNEKVLAMARKYGATRQFLSPGEYEIRAQVDAMTQPALD